MIPVTPRESKEARAAACSPAVEAGSVRLPEGAPWLEEFIEEFAAFPKGKHDDQVDCLTQILNRVAGDESGGMCKITAEGLAEAFGICPFHLAGYY